MRNIYYLMRHGWSESNEAAIAVSSPEKSVAGYGLTAKGKEQARRSAKTFADLTKAKPLIYTSDFLRAVETAHILAEECGVGVTTDTRLRERDFGELDGTPLESYHRIWSFDSDPDGNPYGSESLRHLIDRVRSLIDEVEQKYEGQSIVLVSHGDPLTAINSYYMYHDYRLPIQHFGNAEIRRIDEQTPLISVD